MSPIIEQLEAAGEVLSPAVRAAIEWLERLVSELQEQIRELQARLGQNSTNSSKPPSSDPPGVVRREKKPTGRKQGGQPGHPGHHRKPVPAERVDVVEEHQPVSCKHCGTSLAGAEEGEPAQRHQVVEMPPVRARVTEHRLQCLRCPSCQKLTRASLPAETGGKHFGPRLVALGSQLNGRYRLSRREVADLLGQLLDVPAPSLGGVGAFVQEASMALAPAYAQVQGAVRESATVAVDETPWKLRGKKHWLWTAVGKTATLFRLEAHRGSDALKRLLGESFGGIVSSDRWCAYQIYPRRQLCWAHVVRNFAKLGLRGGEAAHFAERGEALCEQVFALWGQLREGALDRKALRGKMRRVRIALRWLLKEGAASVDKRVAGCSRNLRRLWKGLWTFVGEEVEPTNNAAERALRPAVLWRKGCFGNQSEAGLRFTERTLTLNATAAQQQINAMDYLADAILALRSGAPAPPLLLSG